MYEEFYEFYELMDAVYQIELLHFKYEVIPDRYLLPVRGRMIRIRYFLNVSGFSFQWHTLLREFSEWEVEISSKYFPLINKFIMISFSNY